MKNHITIKGRSKFDHWRALSQYWHLSEGAKGRLEWMIFYFSVGQKNASETARYFGISRKTFWKWKSRFNPHLIQSLEEESRSSDKKRTWTVTAQEEKRIIKLRLKTKCKWGREKLRREYKRIYKADVSTNKIQKVINTNKLFPDSVERKKQLARHKRRKFSSKTRVHQFRKDNPDTIVWHTDSIQINWYGEKTYIFTALEDRTKLAFARVYPRASSRQAKDFLGRLLFLTKRQMAVIHSDNGKEFQGEFEKACTTLHIKQIYSRVSTPTDNPSLERFNRTVQDEWLSVSETGLDDIQEANLDLTEWLIQYNFVRPHYSLAYKTPIEYATLNFPQVLPMSPSHTFICMHLI